MSTSISEIKPGTKVRVEFDATVEKPNSYDFIKAGSSGLHDSSTYGCGFLKVRDTEDGLYHYVWAGPDYGDGHSNAVTIIQPTDWEKHEGAQVGDVWEAAGREYFAYESYGSLTLYPVDDQSRSYGARVYYGADNFGEFEAMNPRLLRRRGEAI